MNTRIIGLTGGIASGKSTVSDIFREAGFAVICADEISHAVTAPSTKGLRAVARTFGRQYLRADGALDRPKLAQLVFANKQALYKVQRIVHGLVRTEIRARIAALKKRHAPIIILDVPLLFEVGIDKLCDTTICVTAKESTALNRLKKNRCMTRATALARMRAQMPLSDKALRSDYVIVNDGTKAALRRRVGAIIKLISSG